MIDAATAFALFGLLMSPGNMDGPIWRDGDRPEKYIKQYTDPPKPRIQTNTICVGHQWTAQHFIEVLQQLPHDVKFVEARKVDGWPLGCVAHMEFEKHIWPGDTP